MEMYTCLIQLQDLWMKAWEEHTIAFSRINETLHAGNSKELLKATITEILSSQQWTAVNIKKIPEENFSIDTIRTKTFCHKLNRRIFRRNVRFELKDAFMAEVSLNAAPFPLLILSNEYFGRTV